MVVHASVDALHVTRLVQGDVRCDPAMQAVIGTARDTRPGGHGGPAVSVRPSPQRSSPRRHGQARDWVRCNMGLANTAGTACCPAAKHCSPMPAGLRAD